MSRTDGTTQANDLLEFLLQTSGRAYISGRPVKVEKAECYGKSRLTGQYSTIVIYGLYWDNGESFSLGIWEIYDFYMQNKASALTPE